MAQRSLPRYGRRSTRLPGYDYSNDGGYFVTICTKDGICLFGEISNGRMILSEIGHVVDECWKAIPKHFTGVRCEVFQVMPNHVHGVIDLPPPRKKKSVGVEYIQPLQGCSGCGGFPVRQGYQRVLPRSLGSVVRSFKAAVSREVRSKGLLPTQTCWQRNYHDRVICDEIERFFIEQYIELNPLLWTRDKENPCQPKPSETQFRTILEEYGLDGRVIEWLIDRGIGA
jgi:putative transposase